MGEQHARRDVAFRRPQLGIPVRVEAVEHLDVAELGAYCLAGASRSSLSSSTSCSAAVPAMAFVVEKIAQTVSSVNGTSPSSDRTPAAPS